VGSSSSGTITVCFWDTQTCLPVTVGVGFGTSAGVTGKTTVQMKTLSTFTSPPASWDFTNETTNGTNDYWRMCADDVDYPRLNWQSLDGDLACPDDVSFIDFAYFAARWSTAGCSSSNNFCGGADLNYDGVVNLVDFAIFAGQWLAGT